ncbi:MAG: SCO family protein [Alphaproteobacteria bacterium]|nr:SCO family protein [Alphaproteobacteria bacterium]
MDKIREIGRNNRWLILGFIVILLTVIGARYWLPGHNAKLSSNNVVGGEFTLVDTKGHEIHASDYRGKVMLVFFGYTHCPDICPTTLSTITAVLDKLPTYQAKIAPIFITVDPARDTPPVMADYLKNFHASIIGLTGTQQQIDATLKSWKVYAKAVKTSDDGLQSTEHKAGEAKEAAHEGKESAKESSEKSLETVKKAAEKDVKIAKEATEKGLKTAKETAEKAGNATKEAVGKAYDTAKSTVSDKSKNTLDSVAEKEHKMESDKNGKGGMMLMDHSAPIYFIDEQGKFITFFPAGVSEEDMTQQILQHFQRG